MENKDKEYVFQKAGEVWGYLAKILDDKKVNGIDVANIMLTLNARFLNALVDAPSEIKEIIRYEYIRLLDDKLGAPEGKLSVDDMMEMS